MTELWETNEEIVAALHRFEAAIPGWVRPAAYGLGRLDGDRVEFSRINVGDRPLPCVVLAAICSHSTGSASYRLDASTLGRAIEMLAPAEACTAYDHPNLAAWRQVHAGLGEADEAVAVFISDLNQASDDPHAEALRCRIPGISAA